MNLIGNKAVKLGEEERIDDAGQRYLAMRWSCQGQTLEINVDIDEYDQPLRYHARVVSGKDKGPASVNMDEGGLMGWFNKLFGRK